MDYEKSGRPFEYINVQKDRDALQRMLQLTKGVREVPVILEQGKVTIGYNGGS
ncbi:glutaredoxin [bacterium]|nr:glutaredoxin [bacterium]